MERSRTAVAAALASLALSAALAGCGGSANGDDIDGDAASTPDAIIGTTCVQYGGEAYLRMAIAGASDGYLNWESEGVECTGSFADHTLEWQMVGLHAVTMVVPDMVASYMVDDNAAQMQLEISGDTYDTGPDGCAVNLIQNYEVDAEAHPGLYRVRGSGECAEPAAPVPPATEVLNIVGSFAFAGYVPAAE